ncbi:MAG: hypothetical protein HY452_03005 [Parcubacteria group bacterium]|uniref:Uncharacterized protein n=2 Tax=Candidatus Sungiibacteriota bacterium TaxID=2750080 RepID=A0A9D6HQU1_9BACT|nr:hypothetical protein [Candidatus Sungbacteria bacterium]MBI4119202.1 hypothetical protein [Parcubacteria group bacterium]
MKKEYLNLSVNAAMSPQMFEDILAKVAELKKSGSADLSTEEDLSVAVMNLLGLEEHFYFTGVKTEKPEYFDLLNEVKLLRKSLMERLVPKHEGETWCISKHLLAATMRMMEVGGKLNANGKKDEAKKMFDSAHKAFSLFWALRLKLINADGLKKVAASEKPWTLQGIMNKLVDCCDE